MSASKRDEFGLTSQILLEWNLKGLRENLKILHVFNRDYERKF